MLFWGHSLVSPWRRKGGKNIWCHPSSRYFSFWRDQKIFWCIISCGTFFFLHWWLMRRSTPACSLISRMANLNLLCLVLGATFSEEPELSRWLGQVSAGLCSKLLCFSQHLPQGISTLEIRYSPCLLRDGSLILCFHSHRLLGCREQIWSISCRTNSWCTWQIMLWALLLGPCCGNSSCAPQEDFSKSPLLQGALRLWKLLSNALWKRTIPSLCCPLIHAMMFLMASVHKIFLIHKMCAFPSCISKYHYIWCYSTH